MRLSKLFLITAICLVSHFTRANVYTVTSASDAGIGTLREAIQLTNFNIGKDTIEFNLPGLGTWTINLLTNLPDINDSLTINGLSQPYSQFPTNLISIQGNAAVPEVITLRKSDIQICGLRLYNYNLNDGIYSSQINPSGAVLKSSEFSDLIIENCHRGIYISSSQYQNITIKNCQFVDNTYGVDFGSYNSFGDIRINNNSFTGDSTSCLIGCRVSPSAFYDSSKVNFEFTNNTIYSYRFGLNVLLNGQLDSVIIDSNVISKTMIKGISIENTYADSTSYIQIQRNQIDSSGSAIEIWQSGTSIDSSVINNISVSRNIITNCSYNGIRISQNGTGDFTAKIHEAELSHNSLGIIGIGIEIAIGGTGNLITYFNNLTIDSNLIYYNGLGKEGIRISTGGTGDLMTNLSNTSIRGNTISDREVGISIESTGTGNLQIVNNYFDILDNSITNSSNVGLLLQVYGGCGNSQVIRNGLIKNNQISNSGSDGIRIDNFTPHVLHDSIYNIKIADNSIHHNYRYGIFLNNFSGTVTGISMYRNSIFDNDSLGIFTNDNMNRYGQPLIPSPLLDSLSAAGDSLYGHINAQQNTVYAIELFNSTLPDPSGYGEGEYYLKKRTTTTDNTGFSSFVIPLTGLTNLEYLSATATDTLIFTTSPFSNTLNYLTTGTEQPESDLATVYPNPADQYTMLTLNRLTSHTEFSLFNLEGKVIGKINGASFVPKIRINTSHLPNGIYLIRSDSNTTFSKKLIVHH